MAGLATTRCRRTPMPSPHRVIGPLPMPCLTRHSGRSAGVYRAAHPGLKLRRTERLSGGGEHRANADPGEGGVDSGTAPGGIADRLVTLDKPNYSNSAGNCQIKIAIAGFTGSYRKSFRKSDRNENVVRL